MNHEATDAPCVMLLTTVRSYRLEAFRAAAERAGVTIATGVDLPVELASQWPDTLPLTFEDIEGSVRRIVSFAAERPLSAILAVDDSGSLLAAAASAALGLQHNNPAAAQAARDKTLMRRQLLDGGVRVPWFREFVTDEDPVAIATRVPYPCVVKPVNLNGSRGVMRANSPDELIAAINRLARMLTSNEAKSRPFLIEGFIPGVEVALEGMLDDGRLHVLALFDKPDPLDGPFFEETIYVTPSRLPRATQAAVIEATSTAARALGLHIGPIHAELRVNEEGAWIVEIAGRSIGGLCSQVLRFGVDVSLEELIFRQAANLPLEGLTKRDQAAGVMMLPIPEAGLLRSVSGLKQAAAVTLIDNIEITARLNYPLTPLPEGDSYLGFIFARGETAEAVEAALRAAHACLSFEISPLLALLPAA